MNRQVLHKEVQEFLKENEQQSAASLALKGTPFKEVSAQELAQQLVGRQKSKYKLPNWYVADGVYFPPSIHLEQTSSEQTALYKSQLVGGASLVDATGGFGVDTVYFSKQVDEIIHCELNADLQEMAAHNFKQLGILNVISYAEDGIEIALKQTKLDWLYIDPSRRNEAKGKVFFLEDCLPNVPAILEDCFATVSNILVKTAPMLDISVGLRELNSVKEIHVVALNNEVKELLWVLEKNFEGEPLVFAVNIKKEKTTKVSFSLNEIAVANARIGEVSSYLYEPYSALMKTGAFNWISDAYKVTKLQVNTHLYSSEKLVDFPGKKFKIATVLPFSKTTMKLYSGKKANVVTRNFKQPVEQLRKKYKIKEGTERYLFFITDCNNKSVVIDCVKIAHE